MQDSTPNSQEPNEFALKIIEVQYNTIRSEIEQYLARMYEVMKLSLASIPIFSGALIALIADQQTWTNMTERPILLGLFCLLSPMFVVIATYLGTLGIAQFKAATRAADYLKIHFEDYIFAPIVAELNREKEEHIFRTAKLGEFLFWENYLSQHGFDPDDKRVRNTYDADKHVMTAFLTLLLVAIIVVALICSAAFWVLVANSALVRADIEVGIFDILIAVSLTGFALSMIWSMVRFVQFFGVVNETGALKTGLFGGLKNS